MLYMIHWCLGRRKFPYLELLLVFVPPVPARFAQSPDLPSEPPLLSFHIVLSCQHEIIESSELAVDITARRIPLGILLNAVAVIRYESLNTLETQAPLLVITSAPCTALTIHQISGTVVPTMLRP